MNVTRPPSLNGKVEAPSHDSGASVVVAKRTTFPRRPFERSARTIAYHFNRQFVAGTSLTRWLLTALLFIIPLWGIFGLPGGWWIAVPIVLLWAVIVLRLRRWQQHDYVVFHTAALPTVEPQALSPQDKIPVFVTGYFSVEGKEQRFTWLPGFFRTFATREHAVMCQVAQVGRGVGNWPEDELGLWYIFFQPDEIDEVAWGELAFGSRPLPALAVTYRRLIPKSRLRGERTVKETIYFAFEQVEDGYQLLADLQYDRANGAMARAADE